MSYDDFGNPRRGNIFRHAGFRVGAVGGTIVIGLHLFLLLVNRGTNDGDVLAWLLEIGVYFLVARVAASQHYELNLRESAIEPLRGVVEAGVGAAIVTSIVTWGFIILRGIFRDAFSITILVEPISLFCVIVLDVLLAIGLGRWGGNSVAGKYRGFVDSG